MFNWLIDFVDTVSEFLDTVWHGLTLLYNMIPVLRETYSGFLSNIPSVLIAFATLTFVICVLLQVLGRESGG